MGSRVQQPFLRTVSLPHRDLDLPRPYLGLILHLVIGPQFLLRQLKLPLQQLPPLQPLFQLRLLLVLVLPRLLQGVLVVVRL